jgi:hypothetical protein
MTPPSLSRRSVVQSTFLKARRVDLIARKAWFVGPPAYVPLFLSVRLEIAR